MEKIFPEGRVITEAGNHYDHVFFELKGKIYDLTANQYSKWLTLEERAFFDPMIKSGKPGHHEFEPI